MTNLVGSISKKKVKRNARKLMHKLSNKMYDIMTYKSYFLSHMTNTSQVIPSNLCEYCGKREAVNDERGTILQGCDNVGKKLCICCRFQMALNVLNSEEQ